MDSKIKFFDQTFKALTILMVCSWVIFLVLIVLEGDSNSCALNSPPWIFSGMAWIVSILTAFPIAYGLARLFLWPAGPQTRTLKASSWIIGAGSAIFIVAVILFALALSQYGCS